jgi:protein FRG1
VSSLESFTLIASDVDSGPVTFQIQTWRDTVLSVKAPSPSSKSKTQWEVRGDADEASEETTFRIRMQARFKPRLKAAKEEKAREKISRKELEAAVGRRLEDDEAKRLKRARREGDYHEQLLQLKAKSKHDKYS